MKKTTIYLFLIPILVSCSMEMINIKSDLNNRIGNIEIHRCFCGPSAYRYLITTQVDKKNMVYNPVNLPDDYKDANYKIAFSAVLLNDSSVVYTNSPTDALIADFNVRNIKLTSIRKCSDLTLNDTIELIYGKIYTNYENKISIKLDSVPEDSRCPYGVECIWAGNAVVKFNFMVNNKSTQFNLKTSGGFVNDSIISGYKIQLINLKPYPVYPNPIHQTDYIAKIKITE